jgi:hypothetical protein
LGRRYLKKLFKNLSNNVRKLAPFRRHFLGLSIGALLFSGAAQAASHTLSYGLNASDLVEALVPAGGGITVVGTPTLNGFSGNIGGNPAYVSGTFLAESQSGIPFSEGVILATGDIRNSLGPNNELGISTSFGAPGSPQLPGTTADAVTLTFQFTSATPTFSFQYMFASEEYNPLFSGDFNDAFAFFLNGPGATQLNLAKVPFSNSDVSIASVNAGSNSGYYFDNSNGGYDLQYNGLAGSAGGDTLWAGTEVQVGAVYTLSIVIADFGDDAFDSALFLGAGSFVAEGFDPEAVPEPATWAGAVAFSLLGGFRLLKRRA